MASSRLRVLQLASGDLWAGAEVQLFTLCSALLARTDIELRVIVLNDGELAERLRAIGADPLVLSEQQMSAYAIFRQVLGVMREWRPQVLHTHRFKENVIGGMAALLAHVPSVRTQHGAPEARPAWFDLRRQLIHLLDVGVGRFMQNRIVAVTEDLRRTLLQSYPPQHVVTIANGVAFDDLDAIAPAELGSGRAVGIVGRLTAVKRMDLFLEMAALLATQPTLSDLRFFVIGGGPLEASLRQQAVRLGIVDRLVFSGHVSPATGWIRALDVLVMCSDHEGMPMTALEAMRLRTAIVAHRVGGLIELLAADDCGALVADHAAAAYAQAVEQVLADAAATAARTERAFERVTRGFSAAANAAKFTALYREVAGGD